MSLAVRTGKVESRPCKSCDVVVVHEEITIVTPRYVRHWEAEKHRAPCGLPCMGASVTSEQMRSKQLHGSSRWPCPACPKVLT